jgi:four helix bundle protein
MTDAAPDGFFEGFLADVIGAGPNSSVLAEGGMTTTLRQQLLEQSITIIGQARPLIEAIGRKDRELESQLRRSLSSISLNVAEAFGVHAGNARLRFRTALGSLYESQATLQVAAAWGSRKCTCRYGRPEAPLELLPGAGLRSRIRQWQAQGLPFSRRML